MHISVEPEGKNALRGDLWSTSKTLMKIESLTDVKCPISELNFAFCLVPIGHSYPKLLSLQDDRLRKNTKNSSSSYVIIYKLFPLYFIVFQAAIYKEFHKKRITGLFNSIFLSQVC